jgi:hypothetical protein
MKIKIGDKFVCIKKVHRKNEKCFYLKGHIYESVFNYSITDMNGDENHKWSDKAYKYFVKLK